MKKLALLTLCLGAAIHLQAQGNFTFNSSSTSLVWDANLTNPGTWTKAGPHYNVAVLWSASTAVVPTTFLNGAATPSSGGPYMATWEGILTDPNFQLARNTTVGNPVHVVTAGGAGPAAGAYAGGIRYIEGTAVGQTIALYVVAWERAYADPFTAVASSSLVGFSQKILYKLGSSGAPGSGLGLAGIGPIGFNVPEPTTVSLGLLGAALLLLHRRRID